MPRALVTAVAAAAAVACFAHGAAAQDRLDIVIRHGRILDGTGNPWYRADVGIREGRIVAVGDLSGAAADREVDATGLFVAPGFIDSHSHAAEGLSRPELSAAHPLLAQGITTVFVNPDGGGAVDLAAQATALERDGLGVNVARFVPHGSVRRAVLGMEDRPATGAELERMKELVRAGMKAGGFGLSSGLYYAPGSYAPIEEVVELAKVAGEYGGAYQSHIRDESDYTIGVVAAVEEVIHVAREARIPGVVTHVKALGPRVWGFSTAIVRRIERARAEGVQVYADQYPYEASGTSLTGALVPRWAQVGGDRELLRRIEDPAEGPRLRADMLENLDRRGGAARLQFQGGGEGVQGRTLQDVADERGLDAVDVALDMLRTGGAGVVSFNMHEEDIRTLMRQPWTMTASDGGLTAMGSGMPHPRGYGTFPRKIRRYAMEQGVVGLADAVRSMTSLPATVYRVPDRGLVRPGAVADIVVFDVERLDDPAGYQDPHRLAEGMVHVLIGGRFAIRDGSFEPARHGRVLSPE